MGGLGGVGGVGTAKHVAQSANVGKLLTSTFVTVDTVVPLCQHKELYLNTVGHEVYPATALKTCLSEGLVQFSYSLYSKPTIGVGSKSPQLVVQSSLASFQEPY